MKVLFKELSRDVVDYTNRKNPLSVETAHQTSNDIDRILPSVNVFKSELLQSTPIRHLTKESLHFLCFLTMIDVLLRISSYKKEDLLDMWITCRDLYEENQTQLDYIDVLAENYNSPEVITYYTGESCLSRTVNQACHTENMRQIFSFRVYMSDLHKQLVECDKQDENNNLKPLIEKVFRGKPLSGSALQQLIDNEGGLISMNGFLSTTINDKVASFYHGDEQVSKVRDGYKPVRFVFEINTTIKQPYAYIAPCSVKKSEEEVLFSLGTIWRIKSVKLDKDLCTIELTPYDEFDRQSTEMLKKYTKEGCQLSSIGDILRELGNDDEAEWFYRKMLKQDSLEGKIRGYLYNKIGKIRFDKEDYFVALEYFEKAAEFLRSSINKSDQVATLVPLPFYDQQSPFITIYNNMGSICEKIFDYDEALRRYKQALNMNNGSKLEMAIVHHNLGRCYSLCGKHEEARNHHATAVEFVRGNESYWTEFTTRLRFADQRWQHLTKKK